MRQSILDRLADAVSGRALEAGSRRQRGSAWLLLGILLTSPMVKGFAGDGKVRLIIQGEQGVGIVLNREYRLFDARDSLRQARILEQLLHPPREVACVAAPKRQAGAALLQASAIAPRSLAITGT
ncbi:MAG: hypothetical protein U1E76_07970 [Planctomycetota bacterium]